jgi:hypothetical protein
MRQMANYCWNRLTVTGKSDALVSFVTAAKGLVDGLNSPLCLSALVPSPENISEHAIAEWRRVHWGTSRELAIEAVDLFHERVTYHFACSWTPPEAWLEHIATIHPDLCFDLAYYETGNFFFGKVVRMANLILEEVSTSEPESFPEFLRREFPEHDGPRGF